MLTISAMDSPPIAKLQAALRERHLYLGTARQMLFETLWKSPRPLSGRESADYPNLRLLVELGLAQEVWILHHLEHVGAYDIRRKESPAPTCPQCGQEAIVEDVYGRDCFERVTDFVVADWHCPHCDARGSKERRWAAVKEPLPSISVSSVLIVDR